MSEISFGGLATGLPTEDLVKSLMAVERRPIDSLEKEKEYETQRLKAYSQLDTRLADLKSAVSNMTLTSQVRSTSVQLSSETSISATSTGANTGSYDIAVAQLAQVQKTVTGGFNSDSESVLGNGFFGIGDTGITIDDTNNSLQGLADAINSISGDTGVSASIINDGSSGNSYHLVLTGKDAATSFTVNYGLKDTEGEPIAFSTSNVREAQQAIAYVDGIQVVSNTNTLSGVISGVTINLNKVSEVLTPASGGNPAMYDTTTMNIVADTGSLKEKISSFVTSYNAIMDWIATGYDVVTDTTDTTSSTDTADTEKSLSDYLRGDATVNKIKRGLQSILTDAVGNSGSLQILSEVGITTQSDGTLLLNDGKLNVAMENKFGDVVKLFAGDGTVNGVMKKFNTYLLGVTSSSNGMYSDKRDRYEATTKRLDDQIIQKESFMTKIEARIRAQFNAMELLVSNMNSQSDYLTQQMDILSNLSSGK